VYVAKLSASGDYAWSKRYGASTATASIDATGALFLSGDFNSPTVDFGGGALPLIGKTDLFLAKLDGSSGSHLFSKAFGVSGATQSGCCLAAGPSNVVLGATVQG